MHESMLRSHLNAEIASAGTYMSDITICLRWLKSTFLAIRMFKNPAHYKMPAGVPVEAHLQQLLVRNLQKLASHGLIRLADDGLGVQPLLLGSVMARFCVDFETVTSFPRVDGSSELEAVVELLAHATEFAEPLYLRHNEKKALFAVNCAKDKAGRTPKDRSISHCVLQ